MAPIPITDAVFLMAERREQPMHVGGLELFSLPPGADQGWLRDMYEKVVARNEVSPLCCKRPVRSLAGLGAWTWRQDAEVDMEHHVRHSALPRPGRVRELLALVSRLHGTLLDRHRPLWEAHLIEGLQGRRFAVYIKIHHALLDGVSALRLLEASLSKDPGQLGVTLPWTYRAPEPSGGHSLASGTHGGPPRPDDAPGGLLALPGGMLSLPVAALKAAAEVAGLAPAAGRAALAALEALIDQGSRSPALAPRTILNVPITGARRYAAQSWALERIQTVSKAAGATVNDVVMAMCAAALRSYLDSLGALPDSPLVAMVPVSLRGDSTGIGGNAVGVVLCNLATDLADPAERLASIHRSMEQGKIALRQMTPLQASLASAVAMAPLVLSALPAVKRLAAPPYNLVISNVPGPQEPLYWDRARLEGVYPLSIPMDGQALNITVTSYDGHLDFGLTGCRRTLPHLQRLLDHLESGLAELEGALGTRAAEVLQASEPPHTPA